LVLWAPLALSAGAQYQVASRNLTLRFDAQGNIVGSWLGPQKLPRALTGNSTLEGCRAGVPATAQRLKAGGVEFFSPLLCAEGRQGTMVQRFLPRDGSIRWEMQVTFAGPPWTTPATTTLKWTGADEARFWTAWMGGDDKWEDPLESRPFAKASWDYGPYFGKGISIPLASILEPQADIGLSLVLSPEDPLLTVALSTGADGAVTFRRTNSRLGSGRAVTFAADLVPHEADWRGGLRWAVHRYPAFFDPPNPHAAAMAGTGAYPTWFGPEDAQALKRMAFRIFWAASYDFPYFGMWLPPVGDAETWRVPVLDRDLSKLPYRPSEMSIAQLEDRARRVRAAGFYLLNYFNCSEFQGQLKATDIDAGSIPEEQLWKDPDGFLNRKLADGVWRDASGRESYGGWNGTIITDPAGPHFQAYLLDQARWHNRKIPDAAGLCMDRMWWASGSLKGKWAMETVDFGGDDGVGWYNGLHGRHFSESFKQFLSQLGAVMHGADKVIFYNSCMAYRIDCYRDVDGFFDEAWPGNEKRAFPHLNGVALLALRKPATLWTSNGTWIKDDPDAFFQRYLYLGVYPSAPHSQNDHMIQPDPSVEAQYAAYGPLMDAMRGKKWVLEAHCIEVAGGKAKANLFAVPSGWVAPIAFGPQEGTVTVVLRNLPGLGANRLGEPLHCDALLPGVPQPQSVQSAFKHGALEIQVPLKRGCAMLRIRNAHVAMR
jgi:hypothetical protein